jgi:hypothetical protein
VPSAYTPLMRLRLHASLLVLSFIVAGCGAAAQVNEDELMRVVRELASPDYQGRRAGTDGGRRARAFIRDAFRAIGLAPIGAPGYEHPFRFAGEDDAANVVASIAGTNAAAQTIVITAHYDHHGIRDGVLYPGADDNASGVSALLTIARELHRRPLRHPVIVAALDAEERGLQGAKAFVMRPPVPLWQIALNINLDMLSRSSRNEIYAAGTYHYPALKPPLEAVQRRAQVSLLFGHDVPRERSRVDDWTLQSDHGEFHKAKIPFVYFGVEDHPDYHKPTDTADKIDPAFYRRVVEMILDAIVTLDGRV